MTDAGFFRGTNSEQDTRFSDKQKKLLKTMKFADILSEKVDMKKVKLDTIKPWIATKITELLNLEDEVVVEYVFTQLEANVVDPKQMQINLTGFLNGKNAREFMRELWEYLVSAQANPSGIPDKFIEAKKAELRDREVEQDRVSAAIKRTKDSIGLLSGPIKTEAADTTRPGLGEGGRDEQKRKSSPANRPQQRAPSPYRQRGQRGYPSPKRTFKRSSSTPPPRRGARRSDSRDSGGRRSPVRDARDGRQSSSYRRRRSRSRSNDSRSPKRSRGDRRSPIPRRSRSPIAKAPAVVKPVTSPKVIRKASTSSSSRSPSPPVSRRPIPRTARRSSSSSGSSPDVRKKSVSPAPKKRVSRSPPVTTSSAVANVKLSAKEIAALPISERLKALASGKTLPPPPPLPPVRKRDTSSSKSRSPIRRRSRSPVNRRSRSPISRRGGDRKSPPRYRKRSSSPYIRKRSPVRRERSRSNSPRDRVIRKDSSPEPQRKNGRSDNDRRPSPDVVRKPRESSLDGRNKSKGVHEVSPPRGGLRRERESSVERKETKKVRDPSPPPRGPRKERDHSVERTVKKARDASVEPTTSKAKKADSGASSPDAKKSDAESGDDKKSAKKAKKAKKEKKQKKHKKHRKEKKSKRKDISTDEESLDIEQKLRARALECLRKEEKR